MFYYRYIYSFTPFLLTMLTPHILYPFHDYILTVPIALSFSITLQLYYYYVEKRIETLKKISFFLIMLQIKRFQLILHSWNINVWKHSFYAFSMFFLFFKTYLFLLLAGQIKKNDIPIIHRLVEGFNSTSWRNGT